VRRLLVQPGGQEAGAERVARAGAVDHPLDRRGRHPDRVRAPVGIKLCAVRAELQHDLRIPGVQHPGGLRRVVPAGDHPGLGAVHEQQRRAVRQLQEGLGPDPLERGGRRAVHRDRHARPAAEVEGGQRSVP
jgi:hypothetical protein